MSNLVSDASRKVCRSKKHQGSGGCGDPRCPEGVALNAAYDEAVSTQNFDMFEKVKNIEQKRKKTFGLASFFAKKSPVRVIPQTPSTVDTFDSKGNRITIRVAREGTTGLRCRSCLDYLHQANVDALNRNVTRVACHTCRTPISWNNAPDYRNVSVPPYTVEVKRDEAHLLVDTESVYERKWYHSTQSENWSENAKEANIFVHFGSKEAAVERLQLNNNWNDESLEGEVYELRLKRSATISPVIHDDDNKFPDLLKQGNEEPHKISRNRVSRYVNQWESPGSVSLVGKLDDFEIVRIIPGNEAKNLLQ